MIFCKTEAVFWRIHFEVCKEQDISCVAIKFVRLFMKGRGIYYYDL